MSLMEEFEEVEDFIKNVKRLYDEIPDFSKIFDCQDLLLDILKICEEWIEENQEEYSKLRQEEIDELNYEYEKSRL
jgi:hypothetical protein